MGRGPSYARVACTCRPQARLNLEEVAARLGLTLVETAALVDEKLLWVADARSAEPRHFCPVAVDSIAKDPELMSSLRKALTRLRPTGTG